MPALPTALTSIFMEHISEHGLSYGTHEEFQFRMKLFEKTNELIDEHNAKNLSSTMGHNFMSTMTEAEKSRLMGARVPTKPRGEEAFIEEVAPNGGIDWRAYGRVNPVKNQ